MSKRIDNSYKQAKKRPGATDQQAKKRPAATVTKDAAVPSTSSHHQPDNNPDLEILKQFDLCLDYGPCIGITRLERWERAEKHALKPPPQVKDILLKHPRDQKYTESLWKDYNI